MQHKEQSGAVAVVLAGGSGLRFNATLPKQFHNLAGRPILTHTIQAMVRHPAISEVYVVYPEAHEARVTDIVDGIRTNKPVRLVMGGATRPASTRAALRAIGSQNDRKVLFHDAVRPFLTDEIVTRCLVALDSFEAVDTVVPAVDTIVMTDESEEALERIPPRKRMRRGQTPQGFWLHSIADAYNQLDDEYLAKFTDDCGVFIASYPDKPVAAVDGDENNIKITSPLDMFLAEQLLYLGKTKAKLEPQAIDRKSVAVIFGGTSGLGLAAVEKLRTLGWQVEVASRSTGVDVRNFDAVSECLAQVEKAHGQIDLVANFSGILRVGPLNEMTLKEIDEVLSTNLMGSFVTSQAAQPHLKKSKGHLIFTSSSSYYRGRSNSAAYSASKAAVVNLTQALADEWSADEITVSCIVPRRADTPMRRNAFPSEDQTANLKPEKVADALVELHMNKVTGMIKHVY